MKPHTAAGAADSASPSGSADETRRTGRTVETNAADSI